MKALKSIVAAILLTVSGMAMADNLTLIGRRGCAGGVENSAEAYREAVKRGYTMIEGHVRVTADSVFVTSHDGKTARLGGNLKVEQSTLPQLKTEVYTQTREDSVTYTGATVCTVGEFLDICREGGAVAVLHLKTFPKGTHEGHLSDLVAFVKSKIDPAKTIILTSEPAYIEYLQANHPEMPLMFQADGKWAERLDWCRERGLNVSVKKDFATPEMTKAYHDAGLKIAAWTVNDPAELTTLDIDYAITDLLR